MKCYCCNTKLSEGNAQRGAWIAASDFSGKHYICDACDEKLKTILTRLNKEGKEANEK